MRCYPCAEIPFEIHLWKCAWLPLNILIWFALGEALTFTSNFNLCTRIGMQIHHPSGEVSFQIETWNFYDFPWNMSPEMELRNLLSLLTLMGQAAISKRGPWFVPHIEYCSLILLKHNVWPRVLVFLCSYTQFLCRQHFCFQKMDINVDASAHPLSPTLLWSGCSMWGIIYEPGVSFTNCNLFCKINRFQKMQNQRPNCTLTVF